MYIDYTSNLCISQIYHDCHFFGPEFQCQLLAVSMQHSYKKSLYQWFYRRFQLYLHVCVYLHSHVRYTQSTFILTFQDILKSNIDMSKWHFHDQTGETLRGLFVHVQRLWQEQTLTPRIHLSQSVTQPQKTRLWWTYLSHDALNGRLGFMMHVTRFCEYKVVLNKCYHCVSL